ncbi:MAG TPA: hypothetical protein VIM19_03695 [Actinomycetes bacterium]
MDQALQLLAGEGAELPCGPLDCHDQFPVVVCSSAAKSRAFIASNHAVVTPVAAC